MFNFKAEVEKAKQFAKDHPNAVACTATALLTWKVTKDGVMKSVLRATADQVYQWGNDNGVLALQNGIMFSFISEKGYTDELHEYMASLA